MKSIKEILEDVYGNENVEDNRFKTNNEREYIYYIADTPNMSEHNRSSHIQVYVSQNKLRKIEELKKYTEEGKKCFLFYQIPQKNDMVFDDIIISLEIEIFNNGFVQLFNDLKNDFYDTIRKINESIVRFRPKSNNKMHVVVIKIGPEDNRDYTALKNYVVSSDNRTYNKVIRNMFEYIEVEGKIVPKNNTELPHNLLVSGAPGTGKSHFLSKQVLEAGKDIINEFKSTDSSEKSNDVKDEIYKKQYCDKYVTRVTFYEDYSYENFIGCYKPIPRESKATINFNGNIGEISEDKITYSYVSGPFIDTYVKAKNDLEHNYYLIIEEINRAKAASVFGEIFQLLDRDRNGVSQYDIKPDAALNEYLSDKLGDKYDGFMKLPHNMYIWATMNSADQGVMPLDSAFKRRWSSMYMDIYGSESSSYKIKISRDHGIIGEILWENFRKEINNVILQNEFDEDRCIGPWYFSETEINQISEYYSKNESEKTNLVNPLVDKLLFYLRQDLFRRNPSKMFKCEKDCQSGISMSDIRRRVRQGEGIESILNLKNNLKWSEDKISDELNAEDNGGTISETPGEA